MSATCESPPSCDLDSDCPNGRCAGGKCEFDDEEAIATGTFRKNWFGLHIAQDIALVSGNDVCTQDGQESQNFTCYYEGRTDQPFVDDPYPGVNIGTGTAMGTVRILLSYDRAFTRQILAGVRIGYAVLGGPNSGRDVTYDPNTGEVDQVLAEGEPFMPYHAEVRVTYHFRKNGVAAKGFRPYAHLGGGLAEVDAKVTVPIQDCSVIGDPVGRENCATGVTPESELDAATNLDGWKKLGKQFITLGGGVTYGLGEKLGLTLNVNLMYMLPSTGLVIQPSLGFQYGL
jgi:hypothetical protein